MLIQHDYLKEVIRESESHCAKPTRGNETRAIMISLLERKKTIFDGLVGKESRKKRKVKRQLARLVPKVWEVCSTNLS